uniref:IP05015p n=1 Tax=Drosophila melanogaster TaxID=7227 RepID=Q4V6S2_DROME|nr:IP05015p [Drosophila melanogaster]
MQASKVSPSFSDYLPLVSTVVGVGVATCCVAAQIFRSPNSTKTIGQLRLCFGNLGTGRFYSGCFQKRMSHREASKILSISPNAPWIRRAMLAKHPDRNGSPYLAGKIHKPKNGLLEGRNRFR